MTEKKLYLEFVEAGVRGTVTLYFPPNGFKPPASSRFASAKLSLDLLS